MRTMYDAVTAANIPRSAAMVAGYIDRIKLAPWTAADWARFPNAVKVEIVKKAVTNGGHVLDVEIGDATPAEAPGWVRMRRAAGADPTVYCDTSTWPAVRAAFQAAHVAEPHYWVAVYDGDPKWRDGWAAAGVVAKQYGGNVPGGYDLSSVADFWPGVDGDSDMPLLDADKAAIAQIVHDTVNAIVPAIVRDVVRFGVLATGHDQNNPTANTPDVWTFDGLNVVDMLRSLRAGQAATNAALEAATKDPAITADAMRQIVNDAVVQHLQITGELRVGPATT